MYTSVFSNDAVLIWQHLEYLVFQYETLPIPILIPMCLIKAIYLLLLFCSLVNHLSLTYLYFCSRIWLWMNVSVSDTFCGGTYKSIIKKKYLDKINIINLVRKNYTNIHLFKVNRKYFGQWQHASSCFLLYIIIIQLLCEFT